MAKLPMPFGNPYTYPNHSGIDYPQPLGTIFRASGNGTVKTLSTNLRGGHYIWVQYDNGPLVGYHHMRNFNGCPPVGSRVSEGTRLGYVGDQGQLVTGPHLHSEVAGHATTDGYWLFFDRTRVVLDGGVAGGVGGMWDEAAKQAFLVSVGLDTGGVGNGWGPASIAATKTFQSWVGITDDGDFGPNTIAKAELVKAGGNRSDRPTTEIQTFLQDHDLYSGAIDGAWGPRTSVGAIRYQLSVGLTGDALWGPATDAKAFAPAPPPADDGLPTNGTNQSSRLVLEIQAFLVSQQLLAQDEIDGVYGPLTSKAVARFQQSQHIAVDGIWGRTSDGLAFPPEGSIFGVDYSFARPDPAMLSERGVKLVGRYLWPAKYNSKGITKSELDALKAQGIEVFFIYEEDGKELSKGFDEGVRIANAAEVELKALGLANYPIYFNVDYDPPETDIPAILQGLKGVNSVIGIRRTGLYGGLKAIKSGFDSAFISWGFQTYAWSGGKWDSRAQLQQWSNAQWENSSVDFTRAVTDEYGQHPVEVAPDPVPDPDPTPIPTPGVDPALLISIVAKYNDVGNALSGLKQHFNDLGLLLDKLDE